MMASLKECQDTVRSYDTKAQIVGVGYIFAIGIITDLGERIPNLHDMTLFAVSMSWLFLVLPIILFGAVLYPTRKMAPGLGNDGKGLQRIYYVQSDKLNELPAYLKQLGSCDIRAEIAFEILKTAGLRDIKRQRLIRALWAALISFTVIFAGQMMRAGKVALI